MNWQDNKFFRNAEGEGDGGSAGIDPAQGGSSSPDNDPTTALARRLESMQSQMQKQERAQQQERVQGAIAQREGQLTGALDTAKTAVATAEQELANAFDNGEGIEIAKAQRALTEAVAKRERADIDMNNFKTQLEQAKQQAQQGGDEGDDTNLREWKGRVSEWYGIDATMTKAAHEIDRQIRAAGVLEVGSKEYFEAIDRGMTQKYPDKFGGTPPTGGTTGGVAPGGRPQGRIHQSIADGLRRMGVNMDDPKEVESVVKAREKAVRAGILPETPVTGAIVTR